MVTILSAINIIYVRERLFVSELYAGLGVLVLGRNEGRGWGMALLVALVSVVYAGAALLPRLRGGTAVTVNLTLSSLLFAYCIHYFRRCLESRAKDGREHEQVHQGLLVMFAIILQMFTLHSPSYLPACMILLLVYWAEYHRLRCSVPVETWWRRRRRVKASGSKDAVEAADDANMDMYRRIYKAMEEHKPYLNSDFDEATLSALVGANRTYVSATINKCAEMNFNNFVNHFRIAHAIRMIDEDPGIKAGALYADCGFNYPATFGKVFKEYVGRTPSEYIRERKALLSLGRGKEASCPELRPPHPGPSSSPGGRI